MESRGPWKVTSRDVVYKNPWIEVTHHEVIRPDGQVGLYGTVKHLHEAVGIVALKDDWTFPLVGQHRFPLDAMSWEIPKGGAPHPQRLEEAARKELKEETGYQALYFEKFVEMHLSNSVSDEKATVFIAWGLQEGMPEPEGTELLETRTVSIDKALSMVEEGLITDAISVAAIYKLNLWASNGALARKVMDFSKRVSSSP